MNRATGNVAALTALVEVEYAVVYGLATAGGQLAAHAPVLTALRTATEDAYDRHRLRRDQLIGYLRASSALVPGPLAGYNVPRDMTPAAILAFIVQLAHDTAAAYREHLGGLVGAGPRRLAVDAVIESARFGTAVSLAAGQPASAAAPPLPG